MSRELGIDEAGRGPVLGPLVLAGLVVSKEEIRLLKSLGVKDSKLLGASPKQVARRKELAEILQRDFQHEVHVLPSAVVDEWVKQRSLNQLEIETARLILQALKWDQAILDGKNLFGPLESPQILAANQADQDYVSVAGASILAKVRRDEELEALLQPYVAEFGPIRGGGYPNGQTLQFVQWHLQHRGCLPAFYRCSYQWKALDQI